jgi:glycosidase
VDGEYQVSLRVTDAEGRSDRAATYFAAAQGEPRAVDMDRECPAWVSGAVVYGVMPHNFGPDGFQSVMDRLDDMADLGINAIWLSPCNATRDRGHGYDIDDYFNLRRDFGTKRQFRALIAEAHARGMRVLMDFVPNHTSLHHRYMRDVQSRGTKSPYYDFYDRDEKGDYTHYFNWVHLPNLNFDNPEVRRWIMEAFLYWVRDFGVDGFRVDACWGVKLRRPDFWPEWRRELKRIKPALLLIAEASARDPYWFTSGFDAAYDWTDGLGRWAWERVFDDPDRIAARLQAALTNKGRGFHEDALILRFLNNNDTGKRFITRHGVGMERVAAALLLTLPGIPCIYTGQEYGAEFEPYAWGGPILWEDKHGVRGYYRHLVSLRRQVPSLHSPHWEILQLRASQQVFGYARYGAPGDPPALVLLNFSRQKADIQVRLTGRSRDLAAAGGLTNLLTERRVQVRAIGRDALRVPLARMSAGVFVAS